MGYLGYKPADKPLTAADITDSIITSAKITDGTITNTDIASSIITGQTAETSIAGGDSVLIYDDSASALRKMTRTNFVAGVGGTNTPAFRAERSADVSITTDVWTKIQYNTETFDTDSNYDNSTNYRFTPTTAGKYYVFASVGVTATATYGNAVNLAIYKNGSLFRTNSVAVWLNTQETYSTVYCGAIVTFNGSSDYVEGYIKYDSGAGLSYTSGTATEFGAFKLIGV